jgi:CRP-like cAMP-binding protein
MVQILIENIQKHISLNEEEIALFMSKMQYKKLRKKHYFLQEGDVAKYSGFVTSGCLRSFFVDANGFEHNLQFAIEDWWITDMYSFNSGKPARLYIEALENTELQILTRQDQLSLFE